MPEQDLSYRPSLETVAQNKLLSGERAAILRREIRKGTPLGDIYAERLIVGPTRHFRRLTPDMVVR